MTRYAKLTVGLIAAWFIFSLIASGLGLYKSRPEEPPLSLGLAALTPIVAFGVWSAASPGFRGFLMSLNPRILTAVQAWRVAGFVFLVLASYRVLPLVFALPAGCGDIAIGVTASFVALKLALPAGRGVFITWQALGILDLVTAIALGTLARVINPVGIPTDLITTFPMSVIPTFAVPLLLMLHIICIAQATRWPLERRSVTGEKLQTYTA